LFLKMIVQNCAGSRVVAQEIARPNARQRPGMQPHAAAAEAGRKYI
jgi:hypothetical protein